MSTTHRTATTRHDITERIAAALAAGSITEDRAITTWVCALDLGEADYRASVPARAELAAERLAEAHARAARLPRRHVVILDTETGTFLIRDARAAAKLDDGRFDLVAA